MFEDADNLADLFRGGLPYYLLICLPILILLSPPAMGTSSFDVYRMSQFDLNQINYGCRASALNLEAKSLYTWSTSRHCVVTRFQDLTVNQFTEIRAKAGGLIILLPDNVTNLMKEEKEHLNLLEQAMLSEVSTIPIYFSKFNDDLDKVINEISISSIKNNNKKKSDSALSEIYNTISANGYQIVISGASHAPNRQSKIPILQGELASMKNIKLNDDSKLPLIILVAHLNTFGLYNEYLDNSDVAVLLTVADVFSKLHNSVNTSPKSRLMFLITESGVLLNFQGIKKWLDENTQIQNVDFVLCLDTITQPLTEQSNALYMHVSKPPKEGTPMHEFFQIIKEIGAKYNNYTIDGVHKKINLADTQLAWEHERFSMKRMPAFTLSSLPSHKESKRETIFKNDIDIILKNTQKNAKILAESLARYIYNINDGEIFQNTLVINENVVGPWMNVKSALHNNDLKNSFHKYLKNVKLIYDKPDSRDPEFMLYDGHEATLNFYRVKPAVFDLFLTILIATYLASIYLIIQYFPYFYSFVCKLSKTNKVKVN